MKNEPRLINLSQNGKPIINNMKALRQEPKEPRTIKVVIERQEPEEPRTIKVVIKRQEPEEPRTIKVKIKHQDEPRSQ